MSASDADGHPSVLVSHVAVTSRAQAAQRENVVSESARRAEDGSESWQPSAGVPIAGTSAKSLPVAWRVPIRRTVKPELGPAAPLRRTRSRSPQRCVVASPPVLVPSGCKLSVPPPPPSPRVHAPSHSASMSSEPRLHQSPSCVSAPACAGSQSADILSPIDSERRGLFLSRRDVQRILRQLNHAITVVKQCENLCIRKQESFKEVAEQLVVEGRRLEAIHDKLEDTMDKTSS